MKLSKLSSNLIGCFLLLNLSALAEETIIKLIPPVINADTIALKYACMRPKRENGINISAQKIEGNKIVINCYGHGGAGWTTLFGSIQKAIHLFEEEKMSKKTPIRILGSGCMGLSMATELSRSGYNVAGIYTKNLYDAVSWRSAGFFGLLAVGDVQEAILQAKESFLVYQQISQGKHPYLSREAVRYLPIYCTKENEGELAFLVQLGLVPSKQPVTLKFEGGATHSGFYQYMTFFMNTGILMQNFLSEIHKKNIPIEIKTVHSFSEIREQVIVNCTGFGAAELNQDTNLNAVRGHLIALNDLSGPGHLDYMILASVLQEDQLEPLYMTPKCLVVTPDHPEGIHRLGVIGVTFIPHAEKLSAEQLQELDQNAYQKLLDRASFFFFQKPYKSPYPKETG